MQIDVFKKLNYAFLVVLSGNLLALTGDTAMTWPSPIIAKLNSTDNPLNKNVTEDELSWIASSSGFGSIVGMLPFSFLPDVIGRKPCLLLISIPYIFAYSIAAFAKTIYLLYAARFLTGLSICACYIVLPMYVAEVSENSNRGLMLVSFSIFSNFGSLLSYVTGPYLSMFWFNIFLLVFPVSFFISFLLIAPESPYYYVKKGEYDKAKSSLELLRSGCSTQDLAGELEDIERSIKNLEKGNIVNTLRKPYAIKGALIAVMLTAFQQLSGYAVFIPYTQQIFIQAGSDIDSAVCSIIVGSVAFFASFFCPFIIDKKGRRFVLIVSMTGIIISEIIFGAYYYFQAKSYDMGSFNWLPLVCLVMYMLFYAFGLGPLPLTVTSEVLPINIKFLVSTTAGLCGTLGSTILSKNYYALNDAIGYYGTIWMFAGFCVYLLLFIIFMVPETKGKSFSEIQKALGKRE